MKGRKRRSTEGLETELDVCRWGVDVIKMGYPHGMRSHYARPMATGFVRARGLKRISRSLEGVPSSA